MIPTQEQSELSSQFKKKQILIWGFLFLFILATTGSIFYLAYRIMKEKGSGQAVEVKQSAIRIPVSSKPSVSPEEKPNGNYFIYGEFSSQDKKYKIFNVHYRESIKEEMYSFPWNDSDKIPGLAAHDERVAIFPSAESAFLIRHDGKLAITNEFIPPSKYFTVSPDGKKMFYFKFMSSLGNPMLILRDLEKDVDIYTWPLNSPASEVCDFSGWSADGAKAYCLTRQGSVASLKTFDAQKRSYAMAKTVRDAADAKYYPEHSVLLSAVNNKISSYNLNTGEENTVAVTPENTAIKNVFLAPDGSLVFYTLITINNGAYKNRVYSVNINGSDNKNLLGEADAELVSLSTNSRDILFKTPDIGDGRLERYLVGDFEGKNILDLFSADKQTPGIQFIGWYSGENDTH